MTPQPPQTAGAGHRTPAPAPAPVPPSPRGGTGLSAALEHPTARAAAPGKRAPRHAARGTQAFPSAPLPLEEADGDQAPGARRRGAGSPNSPAGTVQRSDAAVPAAPEWVIELPAGLKMLSQNDRLHWAARNRIYQSLKKAAWAMTLNARVPRLERVEIQGIYDPPDRRHRDADNLAASLKPCLDGVVAAGCLPGDDKRYVASVSLRISDEPYERLGRLRLIIREVT